MATKALDTLSAPARIASRWPVYEEDEIEAVTAILRSGRVNSLHHGTHCSAFEDAFAKLCGLTRGVAVANGTLALEVALRALGIGPGDEVIVPARSFMASASCVVACGATPVFADVDPDTQGLSAEHVEAQITSRTRAIIVVHLAGYPAAMPELADLASRSGLKLIEDCAQAHGATIDGRHVGGFGDAAAFSFCTDKIISTAGEGGMLLLRDEDAADRAWSFKDHGKDRAVTMTPSIGHSFRWLHRHFGSNYRLTEMQAAVGLIQLAKLPERIAARRSNAAALRAELEGCAALRIPPVPDRVGHAYYKFYAFIRPEALQSRWTRDRIIELAWERGIPCQSGTCPEIYREDSFKRAGIGPERPLPVSHLLGLTSLMLPVDPTLSEEDCAAMGRILREVVDEGMRHRG